MKKLNEIRRMIREYRCQKGFTQEKMAFELEMSQSFYSKLENGSVKMTLAHFIKIKEILEIPLRALLRIYVCK